MSDLTQTPPPPPFPADPGYTEGGMLIAEDDEPPTELPPEPPPPPAPAPAKGAAGLFDEATTRKILQLDTDASHTVPPWVRVPNGLRFPRGRRVRFMRYPARWTDTPTIGHTMPDLPGLWRQWIMWSLSPGDEQIAAERALGNDQRFADELVKQAVRAIDGLPVDQTGRPTPQNVDQFWAQLGSRGRGDMKRTWAAMSNTTQEQRLFFLAFCVAQVVAS